MAFARAGGHVLADELSAWPAHRPALPDARYSKELSPHMNRYLFVSLGAAAGGLARYIVGNLVMQRFPLRFPLGTFVVNVTGCFLIGLLMTWFTERGEPHPGARLLLVTGVVGGS